MNILSISSFSFYLKGEHFSNHFRLQSNNVAKQSNRFNCVRIITVCHILWFLSQQGITHQMHKITEKREAVTFVKVDQRRSEVQKHLVQPRAAKTTHFNFKNMTFATSEHKMCLSHSTPVNPHSVKGNQAMYSHSSKHY